MTLQNEYDKLISNGAVKDDTAQRLVLAKLEQLRCKLDRHFGKKKGLVNKIKKLSSKQHDIAGIYIHGAVGRGKSMLMDLFYAALRLDKKQRVHFHAFMIDIHAMLYQWRQKNIHNKGAVDPVPEIAKEIASRVNVLCLDEMQVSDITDAMILGRLFTELFKNGVVVIFTSNRHPDELYKDGLQRESFIPFILLLKERLDIVDLAAQSDYRLKKIKSFDKLYYWPLDSNAHKFISNAFSALTMGAEPQKFTLTIASRKLIITKTHGNIAWTSFHDLCEKPLGAADYIAIANKFSILLLEDIPKMNKENRNEAKRFVTLIDALYERKVKLIATAATEPQLLYTAGDGSFEFSRTVSRIIEMQSQQYYA